MSRIAAAHDQSLTTPRKTGCARFWVDRHFHDLEYLQSSDRQHSFGAHTHNTFVLGCVEQGGLAYRNRGQEGTVAPGQVLVINPGICMTAARAMPEPVTGCSIRRTG